MSRHRNNKKSGPNVHQLQHLSSVKFTKAPKLSVVVPVYGDVENLQKCYKLLRESDIIDDLEIIFVDDVSPDKELVERFFASIKNDTGVSITRNEQNMGFGQTANKGLMRARAPVVVFVSSDVFVEKDCLSTMLGEFADPLVGVVGPKLLFPLDSTDPGRPAGKIQHAGMAFNIMGSPFHVCMGWSSDHLKVNIRREMQIVTGACFMVRVESFKKIGGFADVYQKGTYEDMEVCILSRVNGYKVMYNPAAMAYHYVGSSVEKAKEGFDIRRNEQIFKIRVGAATVWDEWHYW